jgi:hypothetical protein
MENDQAITILIEVSKLSQSRGILSLEDAAIVLQAIKALEPIKEEVKEEVKDELSAD